jgi:hypothetical protein
MQRTPRWFWLNLLVRFLTSPALGVHQSCIQAVETWKNLTTSKYVS